MAKILTLREGTLLAMEIVLCKFNAFIPRFFRVLSFSPSFVGSSLWVSPFYLSFMAKSTTSKTEPLKTSEGHGLRGEKKQLTCLMNYEIAISN